MKNEQFNDKSAETLIEEHKVKIKDAIEALSLAKINQEIYANRSRRDYDFKVGDKVLLRTRNYLTGEKRFSPTA